MSSLRIAEIANQVISPFADELDSADFDRISLGLKYTLEKYFVRTQPGAAEPISGFNEQRRHPRYRIEVGIKIYPRNRSVIVGHTVDLSESGISAMLRDEAPIGEVVRLEFTLPVGEVEVLALARQRNAFRFGFEFLEDKIAQKTIQCMCRQLAVEEQLFGGHNM